MVTRPRICQAAYDSCRTRGRPCWSPSTTASVARSSRTGEHADLAACTQRLPEQCLSELAREALAFTGATRLCVAGGVGLNCSANGRRGLRVRHLSGP
ncbi:carbamoyltransferase N-terminal domain-containing protein [Streptomyces sp. NPDC002671]